MGWTLGEIHYVETPRGHVAYRIGGTGPVDFLYVAGLLDGPLDSWPDEDSMVEDDPMAAAVRFQVRVERRARGLIVDRSGLGFSDPLAAGLPFTPEDGASDIVAVMDAVGSETVIANGMHNGAAICIAFAALYPERCRALILDNGSASLRQSPGYELGLRDDQVEPFVESYVSGWASRAGGAAAIPAGASPAAQLRMARVQRLMATPGTVRERTRALIYTDVRQHLAGVRCPSLIIHCREGQFPIEHGRYLAEHISGSRLVEFEGGDLWWGDENSVLMRECERFITGVSTDPHTERRLATILFTDIVGSTQTASAVGDTVWHRRLDSHDRICAVIVERHGGTKVKSTGDGVLALFSSPSRAIDCALELTYSLADIGICIRAGIHTGEVEVRGQDVGGIAVHVAARVEAEADPGRVLVSGAVPPLVEGTGIRFDDLGRHELKGVIAPVRLYAVRAEQES